ncbi:MAG: UbiX family flavin prenyltransferase [Thermaerobacter sp.]|nr:UbiX family flavin prenyltransferase [Thermaerobacter sp.]
MSRFLVGITGASGAAYGRRLVEVLLEREQEVWLVVTPAGRQVLRQEGGIHLPEDPRDAARVAGEAFGAGLTYFDAADLNAPPASGSVPLDGTALVPCSMGALSAVATGAARNLLERAADVALKEGRRLVLVPRETPLSLVHLRNLVAAAEAGARIVPAMPGFYHQPRRVEDLVDFVVGRVLRALGLGDDLVPPWGA